MKPMEQRTINEIRRRLNLSDVVQDEEIVQKTCRTLMRERVDLCFAIQDFKRALVEAFIPERWRKIVLGEVRLNGAKLG